jgi:O-antigen/teichoic acid export membrane protein
MLQYWFQAKLMSKYASLAMLCSYVVVSAYKIYLLASQKSVYWFALSHAVEYGVTGLLLFFAYRKKSASGLGFSFCLAKQMFSKSRHYILAALMVVAYSRIGSVLLTLICGEAEIGFYTTALTCTSITGFVFTAIIDSVRPAVLESRKKSRESFEKDIARVYSLIFWLALAQSIFFVLFAEFVVSFLYGEEYLPAITVLQILSWSTLFSYLGYIRNIWILGEEKHSVLWKINLSGAVFSAASNAILIPMWGASGAAVAAVLTQLFTNFVVGFIFKEIRPNNKLIIKGLNPKLLVDLVKLLKK